MGCNSSMMSDSVRNEILEIEHMTSTIKTDSKCHLNLKDCKNLVDKNLSKKKN